MQAETYNLQEAVGSGDLLRAALADINRKLDKKRWEESAARFCKHLWITDCESTNSSLHKLKQVKTADKRLMIEFSAMRQTLWRGMGGKRVDPCMLDYKTIDTTDRCRWVDTHVMLADPLTKSMICDRLLEALKSNYLDFEQTEKHRQEKIREQEQAKARKELKAISDTKHHCEEEEFP